MPSYKFIFILIGIYNLHLNITLYLICIFISIDLIICILYPEKSLPDIKFPGRLILIRMLIGEQRVKIALEDVLC